MFVTLLPGIYSMGSKGPEWGQMGSTGTGRISTFTMNYTQAGLFNISRVSNKDQLLVQNINHLFVFSLMV